MYASFLDNLMPSLERFTKPSEAKLSALTVLGTPASIGARHFVMPLCGGQILVPGKAAAALGPQA
jgi:hypothetical protein